MVNGCGSALEFLADAAKLGDKLPGFADGLIGISDLHHGSLQFGGNVGSAVFAEVAVCVGIVFEIGIKVNVVKLHFYFLQ